MQKKGVQISKSSDKFIPERCDRGLRCRQTLDASLTKASVCRSGIELNHSALQRKPDSGLLQSGIPSCQKKLY